MPPPRLVALLLLRAVVATVVGRDSTMIAPPLEPLFCEKVQVLKLAEPPVANPPGAPKAKINVSAPPPPMPVAEFRLNVVPVTTMSPVPPICVGEEGVKVTPPPLPND